MSYISHITQFRQKFRQTSICPPSCALGLITLDKSKALQASSFCDEDSLSSGERQTHWQTYWRTMCSFLFQSNRCLDGERDMVRSIAANHYNRIGAGFPSCLPAPSSFPVKWSKVSSEILDFLGSVGGRS